MTKLPGRKPYAPNPDGRATLDRLKSRSQERAGLILDEKLAQEARKLLNKLIHDNEALADVVNDHLYANRADIRAILSVSETVDAQVSDGINRVRLDMRAGFKNLEADIENRLAAIEAAHGVKLTVTTPQGSEVTVHNPHKMFPELLRHLSVRDDVALIGESGSGKTYAARQASEVLGLPFYFIACSDSDMPNKWFGYRAAGGEYMATQVYEWFTKGGVLLIDEYDNMRSNIGVSVNALLDPGIGDFPNGRFDRHPQAYCVAAGNTVGRGATSLYKGRGSGLDESTLSRFSVLEWGYDEDLEKRLASRIWWVNLVQAARHVVQSQRLAYLITPRASAQGDKLLGTGLDLNGVLARTVFKAWPRDDEQKVRGNNVFDAAYRYAAEKFSEEQAS
jgi:hypothetical protein